MYCEMYWPSCCRAVKIHGIEWGRGKGGPNANPALASNDSVVPPHPQAVLIAFHGLIGHGRVGLRFQADGNIVVSCVWQ